MITRATMWGMTRVARLADIVVTRPNNAIAYAAGQVYGAAADARISFVVPPVPTALANGVGGFSIPFFTFVHRRSPGDPALSLAYVLFRGAPATVLADQAALALSDADIALAIRGGATSVGVSVNFTATAGGVAALNTGAGAAGRRGLQSSFGTINDVFLAPGETIGMYLWVTAAYAPLALEQLVITPQLFYTGR